MSELLREQQVFEPLEFRFLRGAERRGRRWPQLEPRFLAERGRHVCFDFVHIYFSFVVWLKNRNPRLTGNRGSFESLLVKSEVRSHDAKAAINAHPNGRVSFGLRGIQFGGKRGLHIRRQEGNNILNRLSNGFAR